MHSIALGSIQKRLKRSIQDAGLGEQSDGSKEPCTRWGAADPEGKGAIFGGCPGHSKALAIFTAAITAVSLPRLLQKGSFNRQ